MKLFPSERGGNVNSIIDEMMNDVKEVKFSANGDIKLTCIA